MEPQLVGFMEDVLRHGCMMIMIEYVPCRRSRPAAPPFASSSRRATPPGRSCGRREDGEEVSRGAKRDVKLIAREVRALRAHLLLVPTMSSVKPSCCGREAADDDDGARGEETRIAWLSASRSSTAAGAGASWLLLP